jgi:hypothetical protein
MTRQILLIGGPKGEGFSFGRKDTGHYEDSY